MAMCLPWLAHWQGIKPAVVAIILMATVRIGARTLKNPVMWSIAALAFIGIFFFKLPFPLIILSAALIGYVGSQIKPVYFSLSAAHKATQKIVGAAVIDDHTPHTTTRHF